MTPLTRPPLCKSCQNRDITFVMKGHQYEERLTCDYDMALYPKAYECHKYEPPSPHSEVGG